MPGLLARIIKRSLKNKKSSKEDRRHKWLGLGPDTAVSGPGSSSGHPVQRAPVGKRRVLNGELSSNLTKSGIAARGPLQQGAGRAHQRATVGDMFENAVMAAAGNEGMHGNDMQPALIVRVYGIDLLMTSDHVGKTLGAVVAQSAAKQLADIHEYLFSTRYRSMDDLPDTTGDAEADDGSADGDCGLLYKLGAGRSA
jgi:hypothetical protein